MSLSYEAQQRISILRHKAAEGTLTLEEAKEAVMMMRADRRTAASAATASKRAAKVAIPSADELLEGL